MTDPIKSAFYDIQAAGGAGFVEEGGWLWTTGWGDFDGEYAAVRDGVGMWDLSPLNKWEFRGPDAAEAIQRAHSNDILGMTPGRVRYGGFLDEDGNLIDDGTVFRFSDERFWVMTNVMERQDYFADAAKGLDVSFAYVGLETPSLQIQGPKSRELVGRLTDADVEALTYFRFIPEEVKFAGAPVVLSRTGFSGELGYEVFLHPGDADRIWEAVRSAGAVPYGVDIIEAIRVEVGMIVTGYDYQEHERSPFDMGMDLVVALETDAEFMGKEKLREISLDPPNRLKTVRLEGETLPEYGAPVTVGGEQVGVLTSPAPSPKLGGTIGLACLRSDVAADGTKVEVAMDGATTAGTVDVLALYDPQKMRPRS
ncbi:MAG: aminomethyltransferase family protein [Thermoplasmata archaeon]|nr:aminomethyltransferase family protein [Thermoplasmata archaeon]